jgi:hypothetical protein
VPLVEERGWAPDLKALEASVMPETRMIYVCNPSNPTGAILTEDEMDAIVRAAKQVGAWIVADEIYHGAELDGKPGVGFWGSTTTSSSSPPVSPSPTALPASCSAGSSVAREIIEAVGIPRRERGIDDGYTFVSVSLHEPPKDSVLNHRDWDEVERGAFVVLRGRTDGVTYEAVVSICSGR